MLGAHGRRAGRGRETDGVTAATWPDQGGSVTWLPKVCSALLPALLPLVITFRRLEPNGHTGPQVTAVGCLAASDHCCGQDIPAIGIWHQHSPAKALLAGFRSKSISSYNPAPSAISSVAETAASYCANAPLIFGCGSVHRFKALLRRVRSLKEYRCAFVAVLSNTPLVLCCKVWPRGRLPVVCWPRRLVTDAAHTCHTDVCAVCR